MSIKNYLENIICLKFNFIIFVLRIDYKVIFFLYEKKINDYDNDPDPDATMGVTM